MASCPAPDKMLGWEEEAWERGLGFTILRFHARRVEYRAVKWGSSARLGCLSMSSWIHVTRSGIVPVSSRLSAAAMSLRLSLCLYESRGASKVLIAELRCLSALCCQSAVNFSACFCAVASSLVNRSYSESSNAAWASGAVSKQASGCMFRCGFF